MKLKIFFLLAIILLVCQTTFAQTILVNGEKYTGKLIWSDFKGKPEKRLPYFAKTGFNISYKYDNMKIVGDSVVIIGYEVIMELDPKTSWVKKDKDTDELLVHEQKHFDLGILCMKEILAKYKTTKFSKRNYDLQLKNIFNEAMSRCNALQIKYDNQTNHSINVEQQQKWNTFIETELQKYPTE